MKEFDLVLHAQTIAKNRSKIDHNYFKTWSRNMAYIFGFWCADGNIYQTNRVNQFSIKLKKNDRCLLESILKEMKSSHKIYDYKNNSCGFNIGSKDICNDLISLGGIPNKSLGLKFPNIPSEFISDFIRGYFDGDGTVTNKHYSVKILGTEDFLLKLSEILETENIRIHSIEIANKDENKSSLCKSLTITRLVECEKFRDFIYKDINAESLYLQRKYNRFY